MNDYQLLDHYAETQDWDKAIAVAHKLRHHDGFQMLATREQPVPPSHIEKFLKHAPKDKRADVLFNLAGNLHPDLSREQLRHVWNHAPDEPYSTEAILAHPNYQGGGAEEGKEPSGEFWNSYERKVEPSHFAAIKAMYTGEPEHIETHRGDKGHSDEHKHQTPHLVNHMIASQKAIMNDNEIDKKMINGEPHITVYRGVGGSYAKQVKDSLGVTDHDEEKYLKGGMSPYAVGKASKVDRHKTLKIPSAHMSSWSLNRDMATRFATGRGEHDSEDHPHHLVMKKDVPLRDVLHSGIHSLYPGHNPVHSDEEEIVVAQPEAHFKISSKDIEVGHPSAASIGGHDFAAPKKIAIPKPPKNPLIKSEPLNKSRNEIIF